VTPDGLVVGYECVLAVLSDGRIQIDGYIHPSYMGQGIGSYLMRWAETRARERMWELPDDLRGRTQAGNYGNEAPSHELLADEGNAVVRRFWSMEIDMIEPPPTPNWPDGIAIRSFVRGQDEYAVWQALNDMFSEDWEYSESDFEKWLEVKIVTDEAFDPS